MTPISLVVSDVDGTLVTKDKTLTVRAKAAVRRLREAGIGFTITSSRPSIGMRFLIEPLALSLPVGAFNGSSIVDPQMKPIEPNSTKIARQGRTPSRAVTTIGVSPPPRWAPAKKIPCAVPRSAAGNHREKVLATLGKAPASPTPNRNRITSSDA